MLHTNIRSSQVKRSNGSFPSRSGPGSSDFYSKQHRPRYLKFSEPYLGLQTTPRSSDPSPSAANPSTSSILPYLTPRGCNGELSRRNTTPRARILVLPLDTVVSRPQRLPQALARRVRVGCFQAVKRPYKRRFKRQKEQKGRRMWI